MNNLIRVPQKVNEITLKPNTIIHINGIPFLLQDKVKVTTSTNVNLLRDLNII